jgi:phosphoglycerate dehydrogenase-like enzyme
VKLLIIVRHRFELWVPPEWFVERLRRDFPDVDVLRFYDYPEAEADLPDTEVLITWSLRAEQFIRARKLRWIHSTAAGIHTLMIPELVASDVLVTNASSVHGPVVAEHALAILLAMAHRLPSALHYQQQHVWAQTELWREDPRPREIQDATLGLIGVGSIGSEIAKRALAFGMNIVAVREHPERGADFVSGNSAASAAVKVVGFEALDEVLAQSDFVALAAPLTPKTRLLLNAERLGRMKRGAFVINVSRGALIDEAALAAALRSRQIAGAALDVFEREPLPQDSPLWDLPDLLVTPHSAALTDKLWGRQYALFAENLRRYRSHCPLLGMVDKQKGY